jgi:hypothetical protein
MTLRAIPQGGVPAGMMNAIQGTVQMLDGSASTGLSIGNAQGTYVLPTDFCITTKLDGSNKAVTLPDPAKLGMVPGDSIFIGNAQSGQTLSIYPPTGGTIDAGSANAAVTAAVGTSQTLYVVSAAAGASAWLADGGS